MNDTETLKLDAMWAATKYMEEKKNAMFMALFIYDFWYWTTIRNNGTNIIR